MCVLGGLFETVAVRSRPERLGRVCHVGKEEKKKAPQGQTVQYMQRP